MGSHRQLVVAQCGEESTVAERSWSVVSGSARGREGEGPRFGSRCHSGKWFRVEWGQNPDFRGSTEINGVWAAVSKSDDEKTDGVALCSGSGAEGLFCGVGRPTQVREGTGWVRRQWRSKAWERDVWLWNRRKKEFRKVEFVGENGQSERCACVGLWTLIKAVFYEE